ncbi:hypothetical protein [Pedobacter endophyticus]|uniref:Uncharacterized protein n=1 Tax=Pedobacter endophyticus TaxID=2789740 RepID=A0A7U3Q443_9SPHI|nr:hypothetical protein [Pedobacter endophyticus]QPH38203.1 hypothetical protein IZT61_13985 [Pedobacter endophyticus]
MNLQEFNLEELSAHELEIIDGGGFWGDLAYGIGYAARHAYEIGKSLRSNPAYGNANVYK